METGLFGERRRVFAAVPERGSDQGGGRGGVTPCVVSPTHRLPTKCATFAAKNHRVLAPRGCGDETHQRVSLGRVRTDASDSTAGGVETLTAALS